MVCKVDIIAQRDMVKLLGDHSFVICNDRYHLDHNDVGGASMSTKGSP